MINDELVDEQEKSKVLVKMIEAWLDYLPSIGGKSENTVKSYKRDIEKFLTFSSKHKEKNLTLAKWKNLQKQDLKKFSLVDQILPSLTSHNISEKCCLKYVDFAPPQRIQAPKQRIQLNPLY